MPSVTADKTRAALFTDIDNTLIYSRRHKFDGEVKWVEFIEGREQAYIPVDALNFLKNLNIEIVPVTSRNPEQLERVKDFLTDLGVRRALIYNGAVLADIQNLSNGDMPIRFNSETLYDCMESAPDMERAYEFVYNSDAYNLHAALPVFIGGKHTNTARFVSELRDNVSGTSIYAYSENNKFYILPKKITKGAQINRFSKMFGIGYKICAGDSLNDISMLKIADAAFCPPDVAGRFSPKGELAICEEPIIRGILKEWANIVKRSRIANFKLTGTIV